MSELPRLTKRESTRLRHLAISCGGTYLPSEYVDCGRQDAEKFERAGLVEVWREGTDQGRWSRVRLTERGFEVVNAIRRRDGPLT